MNLVATSGNPVPSDAVVVPVATPDGIGLRAAYWHALRGESRGTVCILQGRAEFIEKYFEVVTELRQRGFAVLTFDWRGQGGSERELDNPRKGHVGSFGRYRLDLEAVAEQLLRPILPKPHFALAHSMGGAVALLGAQEGWLPFERMVATTPMVDLCIVRRPRLARVTARILRLLGFGASFVPGGGETSIATKPFGGNRLTSDPRRYGRNAAAATAIAEWAIGDPTIAWIDAAYHLMSRFRDPRFASAIRLPVLIFAAGADRVCATPAIERFASRLKAGRAIVLPGSRHEILMERDEIRAQFWAAFDAFIPGTPDPERARSGIEKAEHRLVDAPVAAGHD